MDALVFFITCIYFYLPAAMANIGANLGKFVPLFKKITYPVDFGVSINNIRVVGDHKNFGGFTFGVLFGTIFGIFKTFYLDKYMSDYLLIIDIPLKLILLYFVMSVSALLGDLIKSVFKRILNISPHKPWIPFDEIDHSVASMLVASIFYKVPLFVNATIVGIFLILHLITNVVGFWLKVKNVPY